MSASAPGGAVTPHLRHRRDIDGLRALAIVPVVCFHAGLGLSGGFVGVDVFFVISGYLISSLLFRDCAAGSYSILGFYDRRIRRIFPSLAAVLIATTIAAVAVLLPSELIGYARSLLCAVLFASNLWFWSTTSYFGDPNIDLPLLHTWSLAVEEQFYIVWPLVVWALAKLPRRLTLAVVLAALVASLLLSQWLTVKSPTTAFYLLPSRAWELLIGAVVALLPAASSRYRRWHDAAGLIGLALIGYAALFFYETMPFPGFWALIPCIGTALLLHGGPVRGPATRLLEGRPLVAIGLISYSLYLWHWPILSLSQLTIGHTLTVPQKLAAVLASTLLAGVSWCYVEQPFRQVRERTARAQWQTASFGLATIAAFAAIGGALLAAQGLPQRLPPLARAYDAVGQSFPKKPKNGCALGNAELPAGFDLTCLAVASPMPEAALWGDSHALQFMDALTEKLGPRGIALRTITRNSCAPFAGAIQFDAAGDPNLGCATFNARILAMIAAAPGVREVYIAGRWGRFLGLADDPADNGYLRPSRDGARDRATSRHTFIASVETTIATLQRAGKTVVLIGPNPEFSVSVPKCVARQVWHRDNPARCDADLRARQGIVESNRILRAIASARDVQYIDLLRKFCTNSYCSAGRGGILFFRDRDHVSMAGALAALAD